jgi:hypothetical protein
VETVFANPRHFTDFRVDRMRGARQTESLVAELRGWIEHEARRHLPAGSKLTVTVTDVDMAGEFEPWRSTGLADVRVIREIYPSRVNLSFALADDTGKVVKEGERKLVSTVLYNTSMRVDDSTLRFEKSLLRDWLAREFAAEAAPRPGR